MEGSETSINVEMNYEVPLSSLDFTLRKDSAILENMNQPSQVKSQLKALTDQEKGDKLLKVADDDGGEGGEEKGDEDLAKLIGFNVLEEQVTEVGLQDKQ